MRHQKNRLKPLDITLPEKFKFVYPNSDLSGNTWDARHLDSFLQKNTENYKNEYLEKKRQLLDYKNQTHLTAETTKSRESCIFRAKPRFSNTDKDYSIDGFPQFFSELNDFIPTPRGTSQPSKPATTLPTIEVVYSQKAKGKEFDENKLDPVALPLKHLTSSKDKRTELSDLQKNRQEYAKWKKELANLSKKKRIIQNDFRSGALNVDHPLNEKSFYYSEVGKELKKKQELTQLKEETHRKYLDEHIKTSENIGFSHRYAYNRMRIEKSDFDSRKRKNVDDFWKTKKKNSLFAGRLDKSKDRIFGTDESKHQWLARTEFLRDVETRNRKYNIVSLNYYEPMIVKENYKLSRDKNYVDFFFKN